MRRFRGMRRRVAVVAALIALPSLGMTAPATAEQTPAPPQTAEDDARTVTLVTGDVVRMSGDHRQVGLVDDVAPVGDVSLVTSGSDIYAVPGVAASMLAAGELDRELFNVSKLVRDGYADEQTGRIPVIVSYESASQQRRATAAALPGAASRRALPAARAQAIGVDKGRSPEFWAAVSEAAGVDKVWLDARVQASDDVSRVTIGADRAWAAGYDGEGQTVAVIDSGVDATHPDLAGQVVAERSFVAGAGPADGHGHGTHVASIIAGTGAASDGRYAGAAPKAKIVNAKALDDQGNGNWSDLIAAMDWAAGQAKVVNMSLGGGPTDGTDPVSQALNEISERTGALFVVAAGNLLQSRQSVTNPASADKALAVGASSREGTATADYSSVGPRRGDWGLKPEISGPGTGIVAARAAGTSLGSPLDDSYTRASGTSMATPHVAAAAAIVRQRHPDWTADQVRDALTSTAKPTAADPVYWQGAGVVDAGAAVTRSVHGTGVLDLGVAEFPQQAGGTLTGTVRYANDGDQPITLELSSEWWQADAAFGRGQTSWTPPAGSVAISPATVTVPAHGSTTAAVTVDTTRVPFGSIYGRVAAAEAGAEPTVRTTVGFTRDVERYRLTLDANDRQGVAVNSTSWSLGLLLNLDTGDWQFVGWAEGKTMFAGAYNGDRLPPGRYSFAGQLGDFGSPPYYPMTSWTLVAEPEIVLDRDREFHFDARKAAPVDVRTQQPSVRLPIGAWGDNWQIRDRDGLDGPALPVGMRPGMHSGGAGFVAPETYTLESRTSATTGNYRYQHNEHRVAPPITLEVGRRSMLADYPAGNYRIKDFLARLERFPADQRAALVDAGTGTAEEIEAAGVAGRFALLRPAEGWDGTLDELAKRLADAGATGIVLMPPVPTQPYQPAGYLAQLPGVPVAVVSHADGSWLRDQVADGPERLRQRGTFPSPYSYDLAVGEDRKLTGGLRYHPRDRELGGVATRYHGDTAGEYYRVLTSPTGAIWQPWNAEDLVNRRIGGGQADFVPGRFVRTEFYTPGVRWLRYAQPSSGSSVLTESNWGRSAGNSWSARGGISYAPGERVTHDVGAGPWAPSAELPGISTRFMYSHNGFLTPVTTPFAGPWGGQLGLTAQRSRYTSETRTVCEPACQVGIDGVHRVIDDTSVVQSELSPVPLSTRSHTEWTVNVDHDVEHQPGVLAGWSVSSGLDNVVAGHHKVSVTPSYHASYQADHGPFTVRLWATYDDGATWASAGTVGRVRAGEPADFRVPVPPATNGFVGYRAVATDTAGNAIDQTVIRAARTRPAG